MKFTVTRPYGRLRIEYGSSFLSTEISEIIRLSIHIGGHTVTYRSLAEYRQFGAIPRDFLPEPDKQYLEVGAGLGEFVPYIVRSLSSSLIHRPIVIDPVDYALIIELLECVISLGLDGNDTNTARELIERVKIITDPTKVNLYNLTIEDAFGGHPELFDGCADLVVDLMGARQYPSNPFGREHVKYLEERLLKKQINVTE